MGLWLQRVRDRGRAVSEPSEGGGGAHPRGFQLGGPKKEEGRRRAGRAGKERGAGWAGLLERKSWAARKPGRARPDPREGKKK